MYSFTPFQYGQNPQYSQSNRIWVQGEAGAKSYLVAPNSSVDLWDSEKNTIYIKSADATGLPAIKIIDYTVRQPLDTKPKVEYATKSDLDELRKELRSIKPLYKRQENRKEQHESVK